MSDDETKPLIRNLYLNWMLLVEPISRSAGYTCDTFGEQLSRDSRKRGSSAKKGLIKKA